MPSYESRRERSKVELEMNFSSGSAGVYLCIYDRPHADCNSQDRMSSNLPGYDDLILACFHNGWFISHQLGGARGRSDGHLSISSEETFWVDDFEAVRRDLSEGDEGEDISLS
jgi:hypothetical protein